MADIKFSALTDGGQPLATDRMPAVRAGANVKIAPAVPFGPYATQAALQTAIPASVALAGRVANIGSAAPYALYRCDGASWVEGGGSSVSINASAVGRSAAVTAPGTGVILSSLLTGSGPASFRLEQSDDGTAWESLGVTVTLNNSSGPVADGNIIYVSKKFLSIVVLTLPAGASINATVKG